MLNNKDTLSYLQTLGLSRDESKLYMELLKSPRSHLELARATGINRTKVYRLADQLEKRSLIATQTDDRGTLLVASDPNTLEVDLVTREETLKNQRAIFKQLLPNLESIKEAANSPLSFSVQTYEGVEGFKQMLWHELKATDEMVIFGSGNIEDLVPSKRWAEKHRAMTVDAGYRIRELLNPNGKRAVFTLNEQFMSRYTKRYIPEETLLLKNQISICNDTVATYCWRDEQKVGVEITNHAHAEMMRLLFEHYWQRADQQ
jgi:sugar-specific transcriptional regulator TrmB